MIGLLKQWRRNRSIYRAFVNIDRALIRRRIQATQKEARTEEALAWVYEEARRSGVAVEHLKQAARLLGAPHSDNGGGS